MILTYLQGGEIKLHPFLRRSLEPKRAIALGILVVLGLIPMVYVTLHSARKSYVHNQPLDDPKMGFQFLEPMKLPPGFEIKSRRIDVSSEDGEVFGIGAVMSLRTEDAVYSIRESRHMGEDKNTALRNFDTEIIQVTCTAKKSPRNRTHRLCEWPHLGRRTP